jgi:hypothetical protein
VTYDGTTARRWVDGVQYDSSTGSIAASNPGHPLLFGRHNYSSNHGAVTLDEVRISKVARYSTGFTPAHSFTVDSDTVAYWRCNEGNGTTLQDETSTHDATLEGSPVPTWVEGR